ncbi:S-adenosyl-L-methionine-dependent methyltransferase [Lasiosphaeris hirsuta]|uniref:S-adenosyl-L-methionine-dependent methyltransferase n=1 Tax=Lasiosphaeris hirsuta TaxID=260670 RepID=A0AA40E5A5_9PEZI|nr:S-adenosyl-L-methionine-dependent methyltransferase [Lasiosphaeris hirsuta]
MTEAASSPKDVASPEAAATPTDAASLPAAGPDTVIEADAELNNFPDNDNDSAFGSDSVVASDTASLASSVLKYRVENGRTYHAYKAGSYFMPNDEHENSRLDLQHNLCVMTLGDKLYSSPVGKKMPLNRVLDGGTGTGIWAMDFADEHPETAVVGTDLSPIQPVFVPPNVEFFIDDLEADWTFVKPFDFIYFRMMAGSLKDWPRLFRQSFEHLRPGGYVEILDPVLPLLCDDGTLKEDSALLRWNNLMLEASNIFGATLGSAAHYKQQLADAGFVNVVEVTHKWPTNGWPKDPLYKTLGEWNFANMYEGVSGMSLFLFPNFLGWSIAEVELFIIDVRKEMKDRRIHAYWNMQVCSTILLQRGGKAY